LEIATARLRLVACSAELVEAALHDRRRLETVLGARIPDGWPLADLAGFPFLHEQMRREPGLEGWGPWMMVWPDQRVLVGDAGFKGKPDADGVVEVGYAVLPDYRRRGFATEAVVALIGWAFSQEARAVLAECDQENVGSIGVLQRVGLRQTGRKDRMIVWRIEKP